MRPRGIMTYDIAKKPGYLVDDSGVQSTVLYQATERAFRPFMGTLVSGGSLDSVTLHRRECPQLQSQRRILRGTDINGAAPKHFNGAC